MIMPRGQELLLPVNPVFIAITLLLGLVLNMLPLGQLLWTPDILLILLAFWGIHQPERIGMGIAFMLGLCMDVQESALLGQHALAYAALMFGTSWGHRRLLWFKPWVQAPQMLGLFAGVHALQWLVRFISGSGFAGPELALAPLLEALLWPLASWLLLLPQRRPPDRDANRPL
ncbi:MAG: rod shape-determining protein MreD [Giesbergeria sp.]|uniref:rod shape-determining protein MreD n=1 Tax=Giesbergeria sp. TaxID=2818473 RepID=UPI00260C4EB7|nr:rod shape-determining protein MreD [Giesbergeria sp.]MDD2610487.1 rod shape-determining protein MreD [Giesbergeria sp.]